MSQPQAQELLHRYGNALGYDSYMGRWSTYLAPPFLDFAALQNPADVLDVGCGTGNLLAAATASFPDARFSGVDSSRTLLRQAMSRKELVGCNLYDGVAQHLPFEDDSFDACLSLLVLQEFTDVHVTLCEMRRVTRPNGVVAACKWDYARMPVVAALTTAISTVSPNDGERLSSNSPDLLCDEIALASAWRKAGFREVSTARITAIHRYRDFDELWTSMLGGTTESTIMLTALPDRDREAARRIMKTNLNATSLIAGLEIKAESLVVRGIALACPLAPFPRFDDEVR